MTGSARPLGAVRLAELAEEPGGGDRVAPGVGAVDAARREGAAPDADVGGCSLEGVVAGGEEA